tara:strand:+ start:1302 stop:1637 length:336 start_codon:yes stop_codon:yes gene_type:complete
MTISSNPAALLDSDMLLNRGQHVRGDAPVASVGVDNHELAVDFLHRTRSHHPSARTGELDSSAGHQGEAHFVSQLGAGKSDRVRHRPKLVGSEATADNGSVDLGNSESSHE